MPTPIGGYRDPYDDGYPEEDDSRFHGDDWKRTPSEGSPEPERHETPQAPRTPDGLPIPVDVLKWYAVTLRKWILTEVFDSDGKWTVKYERWYRDRISDFLAI